MSLVSGRAFFNIRNSEELVIVAAPPIGRIRMVTFFRFVNNDSASHTPDFRVRSTNAVRLSNDDEYIRTYPLRTLANKEWMEDRSPVVLLAHEEFWVVELAATPTDKDNPPSAFVTWLDDNVIVDIDVDIDFTRAPPIILPR